MLLGIPCALRGAIGREFVGLCEAICGERKIFCIFLPKNFARNKKRLIFAPANTKYAEIAQLVEHNLAKVGVASSSLVFRSK